MGSFWLIISSFFFFKIEKHLSVKIQWSVCLKKAGSKVDVSQGSCASQVGRVSEGRDPVLHQVCGRREEVWPAAGSTSCGGWVLFLFFDAGSVLYRGVFKLLGSSNFSATASQTSKWETEICAVIPGRSLLCFFHLWAVCAASGHSLNLRIPQVSRNTVCPCLAAARWGGS